MLSLAHSLSGMRRLTLKLDAALSVLAAGRLTLGCPALGCKPGMPPMSMARV